MVNYRDEILDHITKERDYYREQTQEIRFRRNKMYKESFTDEWQEITDAYRTALFMKMYDLLIDKLTTVPFDELYIELESLELDKIFELDN